MSTIRFAKRGSKFALNFPYDPKLVEFVKSVPTWARSYEATTKTWTLDAQYATSLAADFRALGHTVLGFEAQQERARRAPPPPPPPLPPAADGWAVLLLQRAGEAGLEQAVFRALARVLHTDVGGDAAMMSELNAARRDGMTGSKAAG